MDMIKLIVSDVDGTLVDKSEIIPQELVDIVRRCQDAGIVFSLATGRTNELASPFIKALGIKDPCVLANGAYIMNGDICVVEHGFCLAPIREPIIMAHDMGMTVTISDTYVERATAETDYVRFHKSIGNRFTELLPLDSIKWDSDRFHKVLIMDEHRTGKIELIREHMVQYADLYWITTYSDKAVELGPKGCNKATGVVELAQVLGIEMDQVMACGDYRNDYEMISKAGVGVAVANALPEIKAVAKYTSKASFAYGVVEAIEANCFK